MTGFDLEGKYLFGNVYCEFGGHTDFQEEEGVLTKTIRGRVTELGLCLAECQFYDRDQVIFFGDSENVKSRPISISKVFGRGADGYLRKNIYYRNVINVSKHSNGYTIDIRIIDATGDFIDEIEKINFDTHTLEIEFHIEKLAGEKAYFTYGACVRRKKIPHSKDMTVHKLPAGPGRWLRRILGS
ncbi:hypothetical protein OCK02_15375 [Rhizobium sp. TRM96647]|uniref:hypothetical protein n=1 Tax=unclassified Rhizobium TaxID=2613769 RepID=UPI0021E8C05A|nr:MULTISPECIES: hypothetical protein [unclassified Rhizobium]MCV3737596.1 hypothetical protein [Rhizobium sp. TRM96647]MCV3756314.1 hypothetical protein [Rhizobium sp. TRM96650]